MGRGVEQGVAVDDERHRVHADRHPGVVRHGRHLRARPGPGDRLPALHLPAWRRGLPDDGGRDLFRTFGARGDVTLEAFGWLLVQTGDGPDFEPAEPVDPARLRSLVLEAEQRRRRYLEGRFGTEGAQQVERSNKKLFSKDT